MRHVPRDIRHGFTLIELLISLSILFIVAGAGLWFMPGVYRKQMITSERDTIVETLERSRAKALANIRQSDHGVRITENEFVIFEGSSYSSRTAEYDGVFPRSGGFSIDGLSEVVFRSPDSFVATTGSIAVGFGELVFSVSINSEGAINW